MEFLTDEVIDVMGGLPDGFTDSHRATSEDPQSAADTPNIPTPPVSEQARRPDFTTKVPKQKDDTTEFPDEVIRGLRTNGSIPESSKDDPIIEPVSSMNRAERLAQPVYKSVTFPPNSPQFPIFAENSEKEPFSTTQPGVLRRNIPYRKGGVVAASIFTVAVLSPFALSAISNDVSNNPGVERSTQDDLTEAESDNEPKTSVEQGQNPEQLINPFPNLSPSPLEPIQFSVPNTLTIGDSNGCLELAQPVATSAVFAHDNITRTPESGPSYIRAMYESRPYYLELPNGGVIHTFGACGLNGAQISAEPTGEVSSENIAQQAVTVELGEVSTVGEQMTALDSIKILPWDDVYRDVKGENIQYCTNLTGSESGTNPNGDCATITTLDETAQNKLRASALLVIGDRVEQTCSSESLKALKTAIRTDIKDGVISQGIDGLGRKDVTVGFTGFNSDSYLDGDLSELAAAGAGTVDEMKAMFPGIEDTLIINGCNEI